MRAMLLLFALLPAAASAARVAGRVVDEAGRPVPGAEVHALAFDAFEEEPIHRVLRTDAAGVFSWVEEPPDDVGVLACSPGFAPAQAVWVRGGAPVLLRLCAPRTVAGRLLGPDGAPAAGVLVCFHGLPWKDARMPTEVPIPAPLGIQERFQTRSDAAGTYRLEGLPPGKVFLIARDPRYLSSMAWFEAGDKPVDAHLRAGCRVRGRVLAGEAGLAGWTIACRGLGYGEPPVVTGADGSFLFYGLPPGRHTLHARPPASVAQVAASQEVTLSEAQPEAQAVFHASRGCILRVRAVDAETKALLQGVPVSLSTPDGGPRFPRTGEDGEVVRRLPRGTARLQVRSGSEDAPAIETTAALKEGEERTVELAVRGWKTLVGKVVDIGGQAIGGVVVVATAAPSKMMGPAASALSADDGSFTLRGFLAGPLEITASGGDESAASLNVKPPYPDTLRLQMGPLPQITLVGRAVDERGRPAARLPVRAQQKRTEDERMMPTEPDAVETDQEGRYRIVLRDLTGSYSICASPEYRTLRAGESLGDQGPERRFSDLVVLSSDAAVSGRVLDAKGKAVAGAAVFWAAGTARCLTATDADGRFRLEGLPNRTVSLVIRKRGFGAAIVPATPGQDATVTLKE